MSNIKEDILKSLEPLFQQAIKEKKWFLSTYQAMIFSPKELRDKHAAGELIWGPSNWRLIDPPEQRDPQEAFDRIVSENDKLRIRIHNGLDI